MCKIHCISYSKDGSCLAFAGKTGYRVWAYEDCRCMARCARHPPDYTTCRSAERCYIILGEYLTTLFLLPGCYGGWHWRLGPHGPVYSSTPPHMTHRRPHVTHSDSIIGTLPVTWEGRRARWLAATAVVLTVAQLLYWHSHGLDYQEFSLSLSLSLWKTAIPTTLPLFCVQCLIILYTYSVSIMPIHRFYFSDLICTSKHVVLITPFFFWETSQLASTFFLSLLLSLTLSLCLYKTWKLKHRSLNVQSRRMVIVCLSKWRIVKLSYIFQITYFATNNMWYVIQILTMNDCSGS